MKKRIDFRTFSFLFSISLIFCGILTFNNSVLFVILHIHTVTVVDTYYHRFRTIYKVLRWHPSLNKIRNFYSARTI